MRGRAALTLRLTTLLACLLASASGASGVDFEHDVRPILEGRCVECHGELEINGGLRLDRRAYAFMGGDSGVSALSEDLEKNPIWLRVSSSDPELRMPFDGDPLSEAELATLRDWVVDGAPWPSELAGEVVIDFDSQVSRQDATADISTRYRHPVLWFFTTYVRPLAPWLGGLLLGVVALERLRSAHHRGRPWAQGKLGTTAGALSRGSLMASLLSVVAASLVLVLVWVAVDAHAAWRVQYAPRDVYGDPPQPIRPGHARRVSGTYWRGNCERNPELFNGGYYTTALLHLDLCDANGAAVGYGDPVPDPLFARFVIERAPNANPALFGDSMLSRVVLSREAGTRVPKPEPGDAVHMETRQVGLEWEARFPLRRPPGGDVGHDRIYVYSEVAHYAIDASLLIDEQGRLAKKSDLWLGSLYWNGSLAQPEPGKVPLDQRFDHRPMPLIDRANSEDPELVGTDEHLGDEGKK